MCLAHLHPKAHFCAKFHGNRTKTEGLVRDARFPLIFAHNMPLPWQHTFCHCGKMCLAHLHPKAHFCAKFHGNWSKTEGLVRDARFATDRPPARPTDITLIPIYPLQTSFGGGIKKRGIGVTLTVHGGICECGKSDGARPKNKEELRKETGTSKAVEAGLTSIAKKKDNKNKVLYAGKQKVWIQI